MVEQLRSSSDRPADRATTVDATASERPLLVVRDLSVEYLTARGAARAVDAVSFDIARGEVFGLAGESGCGKSTIAQALLRLLRPPAVITGGSVSFEGQDLLEMDDAALARLRWRRLSLVFQSAMNSLNPVMTIGDQIVDVIVRHAGVKRKEALDRAAHLLGLVHVDGARLGSYSHELSGGMRQRVAIAVALALDPPLMIMDEPTTALDVVVQKEILLQILDLKQRLGFSILFITHDLSLMVEFSDRIGVMYAGRIVELAPSRELLAHPKHPYTQGLMQSFPSLTGPRRKLMGIAGSPPSLLALPPGCRFAPRCAQAFETCRAKEPPLGELAPSHRAACHLY